MILVSYLDLPIKPLGLCTIAKHIDQTQTTDNSGPLPLVPVDILYISIKLIDLKTALNKFRRRSTLLEQHCLYGFAPCCFVYQEEFGKSVNYSTNVCVFRFIFIFTSVNVNQRQYFVCK